MTDHARKTSGPSAGIGAQPLYEDVRTPSFPGDAQVIYKWANGEPIELHELVAQMKSWLRYFGEDV